MLQESMAHFSNLWLWKYWVIACTRLIWILVTGPFQRQQLLGL